MTLYRQDRKNVRSDASKLAMWHVVTTLLLMSLFAVQPMMYSALMTITVSVHHQTLHLVTRSFHALLKGTTVDLNLRLYCRETALKRLSNQED